MQVYVLDWIHTEKTAEGYPKGLEWKDGGAFQKAKWGRVITLQKYCGLWTRRLIYALL